MTINYLNRPTTQSALVGGWISPAQDWLLLNVGNVVPVQIAGNGLISFRHQIISQPSTPVYAIASRENPTASLRPFLRLEFAPPTFDEWLTETTNLEVADRGPNNDPDGDGIPNLLEALFGTNASLPNHGDLPQVSKQATEIELHLKLNANLPGGLIYFVEHSDTLAVDDWHLAPGAAWEASGPEIDGRVPMVIRIPSDPVVTRRFYRLSAQTQ